MAVRNLTQEDLRLCLDVVKTIARQRGVEDDTIAVSRIMAVVAHNFNKGVRNRDDLMKAMAAECN